jgi:hypothetical protein
MLKRISAQRLTTPDIKVSEDIVFIHVDPDEKVSAAKVKFNFQDEGKDIYLVKCEKKRLRSVKAKLGNPVIKNWNDYEEPPEDFIEKVKKKSAVRKLLEFTRGRGPCVWSDTTHDVAKGGLYVMTYARDVQLNYTSGYSVRGLSGLVQAAEKLGFLDENVPVFGIQSSFKNIPKQYDDWIQIEEYVKEKLTNHLKTLNFPKLVANYTAVKSLDSTFSYTAERDMKILKSNSAMKKFSDKLKLVQETYENEDVRTLMELCEKYDIQIRKLKPDFDLIKLQEACKTKYPALRSITGNSLEVVEHYINVCDASPSIKYIQKEN